MAVKSYALTTAARLSSYMDITTPTGTKLTAMEKTIDALTDFIEGYIGRRIKKTTYTREMYDTEEGATLDLEQFPVISTESFSLEKRNSVYNEDSWETVDSEEYHIDYKTGIIVASGAYQFMRTIQGYRVTYTAGYVFDNSATFLSDTEAGDLELAIWILAETTWNKRKGGNGVTSERIGDYSVTYKKAVMESEDIKSILDKYAVPIGMGVITPFQG